MLLDSLFLLEHYFSGVRNMFLRIISGKFMQNNFAEPE